MHIPNSCKIAITKHHIAFFVNFSPSFSFGLSNRFDTEFPPSLHSRVAPEEFKVSLIHKIKGTSPNNFLYLGHSNKSECDSEKSSPSEREMAVVWLSLLLLHSRMLNVASGLPQ